MTGIQVWVGGVPLSAVAAWGDLTIEHRWPYGCWQLDFSLTASTARKRPRNIVTGAATVAKLGSRVVWHGEMTEPNWADGTFTAQGWVRDGETVPCLTSGGLTTTIPNVAIDNAIANGWVKWRRTESISGVAYSADDTDTSSDGTDGFNAITALMDAYTLEAGVRWGVGPDQRVYTAADPTTVSWDIMPDVQALGVAQDKLAGTIIARWADAGSTAHTSIVGTGTPAVMVDFRGKGALTSTRVTALCNGILQAGRATTGWTNAITVTQSQIGRNGVHPHLAMVKAGQMVRLLGQRDPRGLDASTKVVVGTSKYAAAAATLELSPVDLADRDLASIVATAGGELVA